MTAFYQRTQKLFKYHNNMAHSLKDSITEFLKTKKIHEKITDHSIANLWHKIVGEKIANATEVKNVKNKILYIRTKSPAWRTELTFQRQEIMEKVKEELPQINFKEIRFI